MHHGGYTRSHSRLIRKSTGRSAPDRCTARELAMATSGSPPGRRAAVVAGLRTPFVKAATDFKSLSAVDLGALLVNELVARAGLPLYAQHVDPIDTGTLVDIFRVDPKSSLLGTDALRDGVDVPGHSLRLVVMEQVPWPKPSILHRARRASSGGSAHDDRIIRAGHAENHLILRVVLNKAGAKRLGIKRVKTAKRTQKRDERQLCRRCGGRSGISPEH